MRKMRMSIRVLQGVLLLLLSSSAWSANFNWSALGWPGGRLNQYYSNVDGSGVDVTVTVTDYNYRLQNGKPNINNGLFDLAIDLRHRYETVAVKFEFSEPVTVSGFKINDIDSSSSSYGFQDTVEVNASGGSVLPNNVSRGSNVRFVSQDRYESAGGNTNNTDPAGILTLSFDTQQITEFTVIYGSGTRVGSNPSPETILFDDFIFNKPALPQHLTVNKTSSISGSVNNGDQIDYTITITNDGGTTHTGIVVNDPLPAGTIYVPQSTLASGFNGVASNFTFKDDFRTGDYWGNQGSHRFSGRWYERDNEHHHRNSSAGYSNGNIQVRNGELRIRAKERGDYVYRRLNLSGSTSATLAWDAFNSLGGSDEVIVEISSDGSNWTRLKTYYSGSGGGAESFDISAYISSQTQIRFRVTDKGNKDYLYIDNIVITASTSSVSAITKDNVPGGANTDLVDGVPPVLVAAGDGFRLEPNQTMTVTYSVDVNAIFLQQNVINTASVTSDQMATPSESTVSNPLLLHDFGDAPASYGDASHGILPTFFNRLIIGANSDFPDAESASQYSADASGDNTNGINDDENGVIFSRDANNHSVTANVLVPNSPGTPLLCGWLDVNENGTFEVSERRCVNVTSANTFYTFDWGSLPTDKEYSTYARFRLSSDHARASQPIGNAPDGEVEDYLMTWNFLIFDHGDTPPDGTISPTGSPSTYGDPSQRIHQELHIGAGDPDSEFQTQFSLAADGDDTDGNDDENGVIFTFNSNASALVVSPTVTNTTGTDARLCVWLDGAGSAAHSLADGNFSSADGICQNVLDNTINTAGTFLWGSIFGAGNIPIGDTYVRVRLNSDITMGTSDANTEYTTATGEVEDYFIPGKKDFSDAPAGYGIASHFIPFTDVNDVATTSARVWLGDSSNQPDAENTAQPDANANGDNGDGFNDELGVTFSSPAGNNQTIFANVVVNNTTTSSVTVCGWLDKPVAGGPQVLSGPFVTSDGSCKTAGQGTNTIVFQWSGMPTDQSYQTFARFRVTSDLTMSTVDFDDATNDTARDGEVEDYTVRLDFRPTAVTIGKVGLQSVIATDFLLGIGIEKMSDSAMLALLTAWDPEAAIKMADADQASIVDALRHYLDPDGDDKVAVLSWDTLEERGTIGFYVERMDDAGVTVRINKTMLPGLITAPMGGEYMLADPTAKSGKTYQYRLIEQEARGNTNSYGPYTVEVQ